MSVSGSKPLERDVEDYGSDAALPLLPMSLEGDRTGDTYRNGTLSTICLEVTPHWKSFLAFGIFALLVTLLFHRSRLPQQQTDAFGHIEGLCTIEEYNTGTWHPRSSPIATMQDIFDLYGIEAEPISPRDTRCAVPHSSSSEEHLQRLVNVSSYEWKPQSKCSLHGYTRAKVLTYLLRAPGGLMILGGMTPSSSASQLIPSGSLVDIEHLIMIITELDLVLQIL